MSRPVTVVTTDGMQAAVTGVQAGRYLSNRWLRQAPRQDQSRGTPTACSPRRSTRCYSHRYGRSAQWTQGAQAAMSPSRPFILRPVATSLLMAAILLVGIVAYKQLPVSALPEVDYPTMQIVTFYPGASPDVTASAITAPLERQLGEVPGLNQMRSTSSEGASVITLAIRAQSQYRCGRTGSASRHQCRANVPADRSPAASHLQQDEPGRCAHSHPGSHGQEHAAAAIRRLRRYSSSPENRSACGVGAVTISGGQKPAVRIQANPTATRLLQPRHGRFAHRAVRHQPRRRQRKLRRSSSGFSNQRQRSVANRQRLQRRSGRL